MRGNVIEIMRGRADVARREISLIAGLTKYEREHGSRENAVQEIDDLEFGGCGFGSEGERKGEGGSG